MGRTKIVPVLESFKRANKDRKAKMIAKAGFTNEADYIKSLTATTNKTTVKTTKAPAKKATVKVIPKKSTEKKLIHNVFIMDDSGSMQGAKYQNGVKGIQELVKSIKADNLTINTISIVDLNRGVVSWMSHPKMVNYEPHGRLGGTPLYKTIGKTIEDLLKVVKKDDKVLLNITTDGQDTDGYGKYENLAKTLKDVQTKNNFTVTFVGTANDVKHIQNNLNVDKSNTLVHDNTGAGVTRAFAETVTSRELYSANVSKGLNVSANFYKKKGTL
jgi:uncharacterized protein YegL